MAKRVYFAFHYQDVFDFRANVVRNHNLVGGVEAAGYYDNSIWEEAKQTSPLALKRLINGELEGTSVTAVLIGSQTWARRWVRYEIIKSIERGNKVIGIHINGIKGKDAQTKSYGPNPFASLGVEISVDGLRATPTEWSNGKWVYYTDMEAFAVKQQHYENRGKHLPLSHWLPVYDWVSGNGFENFSTWLS
ncbi:MAG TPA: TIR domain-containing protein [Paludibaculum sp.]|jgi:hypothetical protein